MIPLRSSLEPGAVPPHLFCLLLSLSTISLAAGRSLAAAPTPDASLDAPSTAPRFDVAEFTLRVSDPPQGNPFTEVNLQGEFSLKGLQGKPPVRVSGFADSPDGSLFRLRFTPEASEALYTYRLSFRWNDIAKEFAGELRAKPSGRPGPVIVDPEHPKHFIHAASRKPFYHLGYTAYHLLDPSNDLATIERTIDYAAEHGFNKIRFLLSGYPRDLDRRTSTDEEHGVPDAWKRTNYGSKAGQVNPLPAWTGDPHRYDFSRFNVEHWRRADHAIRYMRQRGIVATCIFIIEKQDLPKELGRLSDAEIRLYRYGIARLAAFDNVWWDLGNEHNEFRDVEWGGRMGTLVKESDPYGRLASAHGYADFLYPQSSWADFIVTQQYGDERAVHGWVLKYRDVPKPYINEEYGYEGTLEKPGHGQNPDLTRRSHWAIAMAGGYATYGDWSDGVSYFYMGEPGPGKAALQLRHLRSLFEALPFRDLSPSDALANAGFCLAKPPAHHLLWLPHGGTAELDLRGPTGTRFRGKWFSPRTGEWGDPFPLSVGKNTVRAPSDEDWALHVRGVAPERAETKRSSPRGASVDEGDASSPGDHPSARSGTPLRGELRLEDPSDFLRREKVARSCAGSLRFSTPLLMQDMDDGTARAHGACLDRLYGFLR